jgi:hypothetical protein
MGARADRLRAALRLEKERRENVEGWWKRQKAKTRKLKEQVKFWMEMLKEEREGWLEHVGGVAEGGEGGLRLGQVLVEEEGLEEWEQEVDWEQEKLRWEREARKWEEMVLREWEGWL